MLDKVKEFLQRSRETTDIISREEYETAIMLAVEYAENQEARVEELEGERDGYEKRAIRFAKGVRKKEAKIQRLREALGRIAAMDVSGGTQVIMRFPEGDVILGLIQEERYTDIKRVKEALENAT